jgi:hypothetical protein
MTYTNRQRKQLLEKIETLSATEHCEIFKMLCKSKVPFTSNSNGVFIDFTTVKDTLIQEIEKFVLFCHENHKQLDEYDLKMSECRFLKDYEQLRDANQRDAAEPTTEVACSLDQKLTGVGEKDWMQMIRDVREEDTLKTLTTLFQHQGEKVTKKKMNTKYNMAMKKFSRKVTSQDKKFESDSMMNTLVPESLDKN